MQQKIINYLFVITVSIYFILFSHIHLLDGINYIKSTGNSSNLITLIAAAVLISLGLWNIAAKKEIAICNSLKILCLPAIFSTALTTYHFYVNDNVNLTHAVGYIFVLLVFFALYQLWNNGAVRHVFSRILPVGGLAGLIFSIYYDQIYSFNMIVQNESVIPWITHPEAELMGTACMIILALSKYTLKTMQFIKIVMLCAYTLLLGFVLINHNDPVVGLIISISLLTAVFGMIKNEGKAAIPSIALLCTALAVVTSSIVLSPSGSLSSYDLYSADVYIRIIGEHPIVGTGQGTSDSSIVHFLVLNDYNLPLLQNNNILISTVINGGILGFICLFSFLVWIYKVYFKYYTENRITSIKHFSIIMPLLAGIILCDSLDTCFAIALLLTVCIWMFTSEYNNNNTYIIHTKSNFLVGQMAWIIPLLTFAYSFVGIMSLPDLNNIINKKQLSPDINSAYFWAFVRNADYDESNFINSSKTIYESHLDTLMLEVLNNLYKSEQYSTNYELYDILSKLEMMYSTNENFSTDEQLDLIHKSVNHEKISTYLKNNLHKD